MIHSLRQQFNTQFSQEKYEAMLEDIAGEFGYKVAFKICETPIFIDKILKNELLKATQEIANQIWQADYQANIHLATPSHLHVPNEDKMPTFMAIDFALCQDEQNPDELIPQLIELQGFPSLFCFQHFLNSKFRKHYAIPQGFTHLLKEEFVENGDLYIEALRHTILGDSKPENVILMEIEPEKQKTRIDFSCTERFLGVKPVCITKIHKEKTEQGKYKLYYEEQGKKIWIDRIYNRVIFDELNLRKELDLHFDFRDDLDVQWLAHPDWFFKISKFTLPFLKSKYAPPTQFLHQIKEMPTDLENYVLKPLFSFAGAGVKFDVNKQDIEQIFENKNLDPANYILMKKVHYKPIIQTLDVPAKVEVRMLMLNINGKMEVVTNLVRLSKGKMMGVDFNKGLDWVGGSIAYFEV
ncbi:MAG: hypothetical protein MUE81_08375 [Thermoflexibacter sp.]|nr:hypothetical protein [Thermoflexibacter sp.]